MRNIKEYPVTAEEAIKAVEWAIQKEEINERVGGIDVYALSLLLKFLEQEKAKLQLFLYEDHQRKFPSE